MAEYTQDKRIIQIETPLGKDVLLLRAVRGSEGISRLFRFHVELLSTNNSIDYKKMLGQKVTITFLLNDDQKRYISGRVSSFSQGATDQRFTYYQAEIVPWMWFLSRAADCRIFQNKKVADILEEVFKDAGFQDYKLSLQGSYDPLVYCVQYRETHLNFVSRLMEEYGIFYYFEHEKEKHTLVLADSKSAYKPCPHQESALYDYSASAIERQDVVQGWELGEELHTGKYALNDYNFETPSTDLNVNVPSATIVGGNDKFEVYDYPGDYTKKGEGDHLVKLRIEEEETPHVVVHGNGICRAFTSGYRFDLKEHTRKEQNKAWLLTDVQHSATVGDAYHTAHGGGGEGETYSNQFVCIPALVPFRPPRHTPKPFVQGPHTAVVVGPSGEEIYTDKYGRVKVQFFWDRKGKKDENSSCWVRVSQPWAGKNWGAIWNPRIGQEVIVDFLEGDPDRPIITGRVYNADQTVPYKLPDKQTVSTFKSRSSKGGGDKNYNELRFEDNKDKEQVFLQAERDLDVQVKKESRENVGQSRHLIVGKDQKEKVTGNRHEEIVQNHVEKIGMNLHVQVGLNHEEKVSVNYALDAGAQIYIKAGATCLIEATAGLTLKVGGSFITLLPAMVAIQGPMVMINSGGAALPGVAANPGSPEAPDQADDGDKFDKK